MADSNSAAVTQQDPDDWTSGDDPMTDSQKSYLETLSKQAGEPAPDDSLSKADASKEIERLRKLTGFEDNQDIETGDDPDVSRDDDATAYPDAH